MPVGLGLYESTEHIQKKSTAIDDIVMEQDMLRGIRPRGITASQLGNRLRHSFS